MVQEITFSQWLKTRRKLLDLTQQALADRIHCSVETIFKIEAGQRRPSPQIARLIADELNIPAHEQDDFIGFARAEAPTRLHSHRVEFTPWRDAFIPQHNLPLQFTALIGREQHAQEALVRLREEDVRLLTILGPPGIGKTRLAIQLGSDALLDFPDGVTFVELASVTQPDRVIPAIARTLDISIAGHKKPLESLQAYLYERHTLLILDNFEQILDAAPDVHALLAACPLIKVVATSRAPLRLRGERQFPLQPLALPARINDLNVHGLAGYASIQLFVDRARAVQPGFALSADNAAALAAICARLDGLPLAIEIVAAQVAVLQPEEILDHLTGRRLLQSQGMADADPRHQTLNAAIDWSYRQLHDDEQVFFRRMGIFVDGCALEAAQAVCQPEQDIVQVLSKLVSMNLLKRETGAGGASRYQMLDTLRAFARQELHAQAEWDPLLSRHAAYFHDFALAQEASVRSHGQVDGLERVEREHSNLQAALDYFLATGAWAQGLTLAGALIEFWVYRNHLLVGLDYVRAFLDATAGDPALHASRARLLNGAAILAYFAGDYAAIGPYAEAALAAAQSANNPREIAWACANLGMMSGGMHDFAAAIRFFEQGMAAAQEADLPWETGSLLNGLGEVARSQRRYEEAMRYYQRGLADARKLGNHWLAAHILDNIAHAAYAQGQFEVAAAYTRQSLEASMILGDERGIAMCLEKMGGIAIASGAPERAAHLLGAAEALRKAKNAPVEGMDAEDYHRFVADVRQQLAPDALEAAWQFGGQTPLAQIIDQVLNG
ncbi:MAG: helix-turn-helix domain-containing protein [Anaerolineae bacterium]|nr:helix-turn-helix domain-containing protein [Anaerolineae bacterium]